MPTRRQFIAAGSVLALAQLTRLQRANSADSSEPPFKLELRGDVFQAPDDPARWPGFRDALNRWREDIKAQLQYSDALYQRPEFAWSASNYSCCFLMLCDEAFYDRRSGRYTVDSFLDRHQLQFGGFDSVVLWHAYPRIGIDERNQFDFYRDQPGGLEGLRVAVGQFRKRGVRTYIDYNPWDEGTRRESKSDLDTLADLVGALDVDGIFLDTMNLGAAGLRAKLDAARPGAILEGEGAVPLANVHDHHASWAQWSIDGPVDSSVPGVLQHKWLERRHMQHQIRRWDFDHAGELHCAWMNGSGMMVWENVFGSLVPWNPRDRSTLRAMLPIQRRYARLFDGEGWTPLIPTQQRGVYASIWEANGVQLWTLVNRLWNPVSGPLLKVSSDPAHDYFDLLAGRKAAVRVEGSAIYLSGEIPSRGIGCFLAGAEANLGEGFASFLDQQSQLHARTDSDDRTPQIEMRLVSAESTARAPRVPHGMIELPAGNLLLSMSMHMRECGLYDSRPPICGQEDWDHCYASSPIFRRQVNFERFAIDETLVTNEDFARFLKASGYRPAQSMNFLKHWHGIHPPSSLVNNPVVYIDLDDARAYARWAGKRLPSEEEWQYAAQGTDGRKFPWGEEPDIARCNGNGQGTTHVKAFPTGRSPCGCYDMCGNVWQWTESERSDGRTRFCILRGGSWFTARNSIWYTDGGPQPTDHATKFLMSSPGLDRCSTIGFRCVVDLERSISGAKPG